MGDCVGEAVKKFEAQYKAISPATPPLSLQVSNRVHDWVPSIHLQHSWAPVASATQKSRHAVAVVWVDVATTVVPVHVTSEKKFSSQAMFALTAIGDSTRAKHVATAHFRDRDIVCYEPLGSSSVVWRLFEICTF